VAVAANVSYAMDKLKEEFRKEHPDVRVHITLGGSGKLTAQIKNGAPYHLFMSANMEYPNALFSEGLTVDKPLVYAKGGLACLSVRAKDFSKGIEILRDKSIRKIAIANPKTAPYGKATMEALQNAGVLKDIKKRFVYGESIAQALSFTMLAADVGFIASSSLYSPKLAHFKKGIHWVEVDAKLYTPINQGIVILKNAQNNSDALAFYNFILSEKAKEIFQDFGYTLP
jgi:molybdate transport system substrate-binding protein